MLLEWLRDNLPEQFFFGGPRELQWWQWIALPVLALAALATGRLLGAVTRGVLQRAFSRTAATWDDRLLTRTGAALAVLWAIVIFRLLLPGLELPAEAFDLASSVLAAWAVLTGAWALWRSTDVLVELLLEQPWAADTPSTRSLVAVSANFIKTGVAIGGGVATIAAFGYPVATMLAGLGIGGVAFAFGAQKTIENLFGSIALAVDQPCRVGDAVRIEDVTGTVERIGPRSTRVRTMDRTLVTFPNGRLADSRIETFAVRDRIRMVTMLHLAYGTTETQLQQVLEGLERVIREHPSTWPDTIVARLTAFGPASFEIEVQSWCVTTDFEAFRGYRQDVLLAMLRVVEKSGVSFAQPTPVSSVAAGSRNP